MTGPSRTWVVSRGSFDDYRVMVVCASREIAEATVAALQAGDGRLSYPDVYIEELPHMDGPPAQVEVLRIETRVDDDGTVTELVRQVSHQWPFDPRWSPLTGVRWRWVRPPMWEGTAGRLEVWGTNHAKVRVMHADVLAMLLAHRELWRRPEATGP